MSLGFSLGATPVQPALAAEALAHDTAPAHTNPLLVKTAALAAQIGVTVSFFTIINTNRHFVARTALFSSSSRDDDTVDQKRTKNIIRKLKTEKSEPSNDQRPN